MQKITILGCSWALEKVTTNIELPVFKMVKNDLRPIQFSKSYSSLIFLKQLKQNEETL